MNFKVFFITDNDDSQPWIKAQNLLPLLPEGIRNCIKKIDKSKLSDIDQFNLKLKPIGLINELYMSLNPSSTEKYLTHYLIYKKVIQEDIDCCMIFEDEVVFSDVINLFFANPDMPEDIDIANLSTEGIKNLNAYYLTNKGAQNIVNILEDPKWLNGIKRFTPEDYGLPKELQNCINFESESVQDFSVKNQIIAPIEKIIFTAAQYSKISSQHNISFIHTASNYKTFKIEEELKHLTKQKCYNFLKSEKFEIDNSQIDCIFYINLDEDLSKMKRMESMLGQIKIPFERFSAIKPNSIDISREGRYEALFSKSKILEAKSFFNESFDNIDLMQYKLGTLGCYLSHRELLNTINKIYKHKNSQRSFMNYVLILEDDCYFGIETIKDLNKTILGLSGDWDIIRSTWTAPSKIEKINYSHPLSFGHGIHMHKEIYAKIKKISTESPSVCPILHTFSGGTHFQAINVNSIPKILDYLESQPLLPIDALYTTDQLNVYNKKMKVSHDFFKNSSINKAK